ncbi:general stress protein [Cellulomonas soli]
MSFSGTTRVPKAPTLPQGETVAAYGTYLEAQKAVDHLADHQFPVQLVTIVGTDLRMVERVTGRLSYPRAALGGFLSGAWFGLFVGLLMSLFSTPGTSSLLPAAILIGGAFGLILSVVTYSLSGGKRDFTSSSQIVAATYSVLCRSEKAHVARQLLAQVGGVTPAWGASSAGPSPVGTTTPAGQEPPQAPPTGPQG